MTQTPSVLVVDDDPQVRRLLGGRWRAHGLDVHAAADGVEGLRLFRRHRHPVVVTDLVMPGLDGLGLLDAVKALAPSTRVLMLSGVGTIPAALDAVRRGAEDFLEKPVDPDQLLGRVRALLEAAREPAFLTASPAIEALLARGRRVAETDAPILLTGETGTGKDLLARMLHAWSRRARGPFVALNAAAIPDTLLEGELFGHEAGAFTDARRPRAGLLERAHGGTLFLDEVGELSAAAQAKLLRVLQDGQVRRLGAGEARVVDVRIVTATHRPLAALVAAGHFRADLYYRIAVVTLALPPLRERPDDVVLLANHFAAHWAARYRREVPWLGPEAVAALQAYGWPGNVRELDNAIHRAVLEADGVITPDHLGLVTAAAPAGWSPAC
jgi:DNA-binding NtrC family response regulator